ncbi:MAG TPA: glutathione S-transferase N-terminal domain-containing protein [Roseiarcus sp.]|nr:glutathione S-transferase N-terminal domain-containing protein [Roseiarcus sp.]
MLILRSSAGSPFARKVRIAAALLEFEDRMEVSAADTGDAEDSLRTQNPLGKIPALVLENGETIFDSAVIVEYLDWLAGGGKIIPTEPKARFRSLTQQALADGVNDAAVLLRYELLWREPGMRSVKWMAYQSDKIARALRAFEAAPPEELSDVGTIALACALGYLDLRFEGAWRAKHPRLVARLDVFSDATPSFEATRFRG